MTYTLTAGTSVIRDADGATIPNDPHNADWQAYLSWVAAGNTAAPYVAPPAPPASCFVWQLQAAMTPAQWTALQSAISSSGNRTAQAYLAHPGNVVSAASPTVQSLATGLGYTPAQLTAILQAGAAITFS